MLEEMLSHLVLKSCFYLDVKPFTYYNLLIFLSVIAMLEPGLTWLV